MKKLLEAINTGIAKALKENNIEFKSVENLDVLDDTDNLTITPKSLNTKPDALDYIEKKKEKRRQEIISFFSEWVSKEMDSWHTSWDCDEDGYNQCKRDLESAEDYFNNEYETFLEDYEISEADDKLVDWDNDLLPIIQTEVIEWETWADEHLDFGLYKYDDPVWHDYDNEDDEDWNEDDEGWNEDED